MPVQNHTDQLDKLVCSYCSHLLKQHKSGPSITTTKVIEDIQSKNINKYKLWILFVFLKPQFLKSTDISGDRFQC